MTMDNQITKSNNPNTAITNPAESEFVLAQRVATLYAASQFVPDTMRNKPADCYVVCSLAKRMGVDPMELFPNIYIVYGKPAFSAKFAIAKFNSNGKYTPISYETADCDPKDKKYWVVAVTKDKTDGTVYKSPRIDWAMVSGEGWDSKKGSKWLTMPELMFRYRAAAYLISTTAPEITMGCDIAEGLPQEAHKWKRTMTNDPIEKFVSQLPVKESGEEVESKEPITADCEVCEESNIDVEQVSTDNLRIDPANTLKNLSKKVKVQ